MVTLTGTLRPEADHEQDLMPVALRLIWDIDGVVDVVNRLGEVKAARTRPEQRAALSGPFAFVPEGTGLRS